MREQLENLLELPVYARLGILAGSALLVLGFYWMFFYGGVAEEVAKFEKEIDGPNGLRFQIAQKQGIADNLPLFLAEVKSLEVEFKKALSELPDEKEIDKLLSSVSAVGRDAGLEIRLFKPRDQTKRDYYAEVPVEMEVYGTYHQVATFFDEVGHLDRIVNLGAFEMNEPSQDSELMLRTKVVATTFRFLDESERPKKKDDKAKKRRGRGRRK